MVNDRPEDFAKRQAQWDAFHRWESRRNHPSFSLEERIAWYVSAFNFTRDVLKRASLKNTEAKIQYLRDVRERLAHLK
jgi:hypothetical protein